jgi:hypothetical protein
MRDPGPGEIQDTGEIIDYSHGGAHRPTGRQPARNNPRHDTARWVAMDYQAQHAGDPDMLSWDALASREPDNRTVVFPAPAGSPGNGFFGRSNETPPVTDYAAAGMLYQPSSLAGQRALQAHQANRFGPNVPDPVEVSSGMLASPPPNMVQAEVQVAEQLRLGSDHMRSQAPSWGR